MSAEAIAAKKQRENENDSSGSLPKVPYIASVLDANLASYLLEFIGASYTGLRAAAKAYNDAIFRSPTALLSVDLRHLNGYVSDVIQFSLLATRWCGPVHATCTKWDIEENRELLGGSLRHLIGSGSDSKQSVPRIAVLDLEKHREDIASTLGPALGRLTELKELSLEDTRELAKCLPNLAKLEYLSITEPEDDEAEVSLEAMKLSPLSESLTQCKALEGVKIKFRDFFGRFTSCLKLAVVLLTSLSKVRFVCIGNIGETFDLKGTSLTVSTEHEEEGADFHSPASPARHALACVLASPHVSTKVTRVMLDVWLGNDGMASLSPSIVAMKSLTTLDLRNVGLDYDDLYPLSECKSLEILRLIDGFECLRPRPSERGRRFANMLKQLLRLRILYLCADDIHVEMYPFLAGAFASLKRLQKLYVVDSVQTAGFKETTGIAGLMAQVPHITQLNVTGSTLGESGQSRGIFQSALASLVSLTTIKLSSSLKDGEFTKTVLMALHSCTKLVSLHLSGCIGIASPGAASAFGSLLAQLPALEHLDLSRACLTSDVIPLLELGKGTTITVLDLSGNRCMGGDEGVALAESLGGMTGLVELNLTGIDMNDSRLPTLLPAFPRLLALKKLTLPFEKLTIASLPALTTCLRMRMLPSLKTLAGVPDGDEENADVSFIEKVKAEAGAVGVDVTE